MLVSLVAVVLDGYANFGPGEVESVYLVPRQITDRELKNRNRQTSVDQVQQRPTLGRGFREAGCEIQQEQGASDTPRIGPSEDPLLSPGPEGRAFALREKSESLVCASQPSAPVTTTKNLGKREIHRGHPKPVQFVHVESIETPLMHDQPWAMSQFALVGNQDVDRRTIGRRTSEHGQRAEPVQRGERAGVQQRSCCTRSEVGSSMRLDEHLSGERK